MIWEPRDLFSTLIINGNWCGVKCDDHNSPIIDTESSRTTISQWVKIYQKKSCFQFSWNHSILQLKKGSTSEMSLAVSLRSKYVKLCEWNYDFYFVIFRRVFWNILESREKSSMITHVVRFYKIQVLLSKNFVISIRNSNFSRLYFGADKKNSEVTSPLAQMLRWKVTWREKEQGAENKIPIVIETYYSLESASACAENGVERR